MNANQQKMKNVSAKISLILKVGFGVTVMIAILAMTAILILLFSGEETRLSFLDAFQVTANNGTLLSIAPRPLFTMFVFMLMDTVLMGAAIFLIHGIFSEMKKGCTPFSHENTLRIKRTAIVVIILGIVGSYSDGLVDYYTIGELTWKVDIPGVICGIIIYCIAFIFQYGCQLQRESDETL